jgi:hypothetical protein
LGTGWSPNLQIWERAGVQIFRFGNGAGVQIFRFGNGAGVQIFRFGNGVVADPPGSNTSKSEDLDSSPELDSSPVPKDNPLYLKIYASVLTTNLFLIPDNSILEFVIKTPKVEKTGGVKCTINCYYTP